MNSTTHSGYTQAIVWAILLLGALSARTVSAQPWSGILNPARAIDWSVSGKGVTGGIPTTRTNCVTTQCNTLFGGTVTATTINAALASAPANTVVRIPAGTFSVAGITFGGRDDVTLRGQGADQTILNITGDTSCAGAYPAVCMSGTSTSWYGPGPPTHSSNWTAGYAKGTTSITLSNTTSLAVGMYIWLDQLDDVWPGGDTGGFLVCSTGSGCTDQGGTINGRTTRGNRQAVKVVSCSPACGSGSSSTVVITPGVYTPNIVSGKSPGAWWGDPGGWASGVGLEDMSINSQNAGTGCCTVACLFCGDGWIKGVRLLFAHNQHISLYTVARFTIRDSYLYGSQAEGDQQHYGMLLFGTSDLLIENNIVQHRATAFLRSGDQGSVYGYNYAVDDCFGAGPPACASNWFQAGMYSHEAGNAYILDEGNITPGIKGDIIHGPSNMWTAFRNVSYGWENNPTMAKTAETGAVKLYARNRFWNFVGNVLGTSGYHTTYEADSARSIYAFGMAYNSAPADSRVAPSTLRWGNWDVVTSTNDNGTNDAIGTRWVAGEVPNSDAFYPNAVPGSQTLPSSFYLSARPDAWWGTPWGTPVWPPIGPDVSSGNIANLGGHANKIPAQLCWENSPNDPAFPNPDTYSHRIKLFNAATCYFTAGGGSPPAAPSNFQVTP